MRVSVSTDVDGIRKVRIFPDKAVKEAASVSAVLSASDGSQEVYFLDRSPLAEGAYLEDRNARLSKFVRRSGDSFVFFLPEEKKGSFHLEFYIKEPAKSVVIHSKDFIV